MIVGAVLGLIVLAFTNPFGWNDATERTVVTNFSGNQFVRFAPGPYYAGLFEPFDMSKSTNKCDICTNKMKLIGKNTKLKRYECTCCGHYQTVFTGILTKKLLIYEV